MRSVMIDQFATVPQVNVPRSSFDRSCGLKTAIDADYLYPIFVDETVPGDTFNMNCTFFARLATPLYPIMDNLYFKTAWFWSPTRTLWDNAEKFFGAQEDPGDSIDYSIPIISNHTVAEDSLYDYFGLPVGAGVDFNSLPIRMYNKVFNWWFRDQNLTDSLTVETDDGPDTAGNYTLQKVRKKHDYFTGCLPWPQKGDAVDLPLGTTADVYADPVGAGTLSLLVDDGLGGTRRDLVESAGDLKMANTQSDGHILKVDLSGASSATINDIRLAFQTQRFLERDARAGTRYTEHVKAHYGTIVPDFRVQEPEFLGGGTSPINITPVANTSDDGTQKQGDLTAYGTVAGRHSFSKSFVEHGYILGVAWVVGDITYSQGLERLWSRSTRYDVFYPVFSMLGEQEILNKEIFWSNGAADDQVFGYNERHADYRYKQSKLTSLMRPNHSATLAPWHLSEDFATLPSLGDTFIRSNTGVPLDRAIAVPSEPHFIVDMFFDLRCARPMPLRGIPGRLDHL